MMDKYKPFERPERPLDPPERPNIPASVSGYYMASDDEFIPDEDAFEYALENWDLMPKDKRQMFKQDLVELFFDGWERVRGE